MLRKATALLLILILGLYAPVVAMPLCLCDGHIASSQKIGCCEEAKSCCPDSGAESEPCCGDPECCIVVPGMPEGMEPQLSHAPTPVPTPALISLLDSFDSAPQPVETKATRLSDPPPPAVAPVRIAYGVWRL